MSVHSIAFSGARKAKWTQSQSLIFVLPAIGRLNFKVSTQWWDDSWFNFRAVTPIVGFTCICCRCRCRRPVPQSTSRHFYFYLQQLSTSFGLDGACDAHGKLDSSALMRLQNKYFLFGECESRDFYIIACCDVPARVLYFIFSRAHCNRRSKRKTQPSIADNFADNFFEKANHFNQIRLNIFFVCDH